MEEEDEEDSDQDMEDEGEDAEHEGEEEAECRGWQKRMDDAWKAQHGSPSDSDEEEEEGEEDEGLHVLHQTGVHAEMEEDGEDEGNNKAYCTWHGVFTAQQA